MNTEQFDGHTPGPWDLIANYSEREWDNTWEGAVHLFITLGLGIDRESLSVADARLIAAAPDLLAEVERLRQMVRQLFDKADGDFAFNWAVKNISEQDMPWFVGDSMYSLMQAQRRSEEE